MTEANSHGNSFEALAMPLFASLYNFAHWLTQNREKARQIDSQLADIPNRRGGWIAVFRVPQGANNGKPRR